MKVKCTVWIVLAGDWYARKTKGEMRGWRTKSNIWQKAEQQV